MENRRKSRNLKQARSFSTKEKIIEASYKLFCEKGYYKTTSIEIAKVACVSIGCFYSYFKDKDAVFYEVLDLYNKSFLEVNTDILNNLDFYKENREDFLSLLIDKLVKVHEDSKDLNRELTLLYCSNDKVASILDEQHEKIREITRSHLKLCKDDIKLTDIEAASIIVTDIINTTVDRIVFKKNVIDSDRIKKACVEAVNKYLLL